MGRLDSSWKYKHEVGCEVFFGATNRGEQQHSGRISMVGNPRGRLDEEETPSWLHTSFSDPAVKLYAAEIKPVDSDMFSDSDAFTLVVISYHCRNWV